MIVGNIMLQKNYFLIVLAFLILVIASPSLAKQKKKEKKKIESATQTEVMSRFEALGPEEKRQFDSLSDEQKNSIMKGKVDLGFNEWMVELAIGKPFYGTEHHPIYVDYEQVWLYTKPEITTKVNEEKIMDKQTNWPTIYRTSSTQSCTIGDFFLLYDRGVVDKIVPVTDRKVYGSCTLETSEAYLPIVDGKPVEPSAVKSEK